MAFASDLAELNTKVMKAFGEPATAVIYVSLDPTVDAATVDSIPIDPIRLGDSFPNTFTVRWVKLVDLAAAGITPQSGDQVIIGSATYTVDQIQNDMGGGIRLILAKR